MALIDALYQAPGLFIQGGLSCNDQGCYFQSAKQTTAIKLRGREFDFLANRTKDCSRTKHLHRQVFPGRWTMGTSRLSPFIWWPRSLRMIRCPTLIFDVRFTMSHKLLQHAEAVPKRLVLQVCELPSCNEIAVFVDIMAREVIPSYLWSIAIKSLLLDPWSVVWRAPTVLERVCRWGSNVLRIHTFNKQESRRRTMTQIAQGFFLLQQHSRCGFVL